MRPFGRGAGLLLMIAAAALTGCRHKVPPPLPIPPPTPVAVPASPPTTAKIPPVPSPPAPLTPVKVPEKKIKKPKKKIAAALPAQPLVLPPPPSPPPVAAPPPAALGTLTLGEGGTSARQEAEASIAMLERRLAGVSADLMKTQREQIGRVEHFAQEARRALNGGDAEGAQTLATKGKLILDDLLK